MSSFIVQSVTGGTVSNFGLLIPFLLGLLSCGIMTSRRFPAQLSCSLYRRIDGMIDDILEARCMEAFESRFSGSVGTRDVSAELRRRVW
jgi:hypothetical protein